MSEDIFCWKSNMFVKSLWTWIRIKKLFKRKPVKPFSNKLSKLRDLPYHLNSFELEELIFYSVTRYKQLIETEKSLAEIYKKTAELYEKSLTELEKC